MARSFEEFGNGDGNGNSCPRCQENAKAGAVNIRLHKMMPDSSSRFKQVTSRQVSLCEPCSVEVYEAVVALLNSETNGGTRKARSTPPRPATPAATTRRRRRTSAARG